MRALASAFLASTGGFVSDLFHALKFVSMTSMGLCLALSQAFAQTTAPGGVAERHGDHAGAPYEEAIRWVEQHRMGPPAEGTPGGTDALLARIGDAVGDVPVVAFGEGTHAAAEPLEFRNKLFRYLVEKKGFTAIAFEGSPVWESRSIYDYARGAPGELETALAQGIGFTFDQLPQNRELVAWMRRYNSDPMRQRKINFYGLDITGDAWSKSYQGSNSALALAISYVQKVDPANAELLLNGIAPYLPQHRPYGSLKPAERDALTAGIADLISLFERQEMAYAAASSQTDYAWAYRAALNARQLDEFERRSASEADSVNVARASLVQNSVRDRAIADNFDWVREQEGPNGKVLVFAHTIHLVMSPISARYVSNDDLEHQPSAAVVGPYLWGAAGSILKHRLGNQLLTIGSVVGSGSMGCVYWAPGSQSTSATHWTQTLPLPPVDSFTGVLNVGAVSPYLIDFRSSAALPGWFDRQEPFGYPIKLTKLNEIHEVYEINPRRSFDIVLYLPTVTPACPQ